ncbi:hypothetical protein KE018_004082 [Escherichia coli]
MAFTLVADIFAKVDGAITSMVSALLINHWFYLRLITDGHFRFRSVPDSANCRQLG